MQSTSSGCLEHKILHRSTQVSLGANKHAGTAVWGVFTKDPQGKGVLAQPTIKFISLPYLN